MRCTLAAALRVRVHAVLTGGFDLHEQSPKTMKLVNSCAIFGVAHQKLRLIYIFNIDQNIPARKKKSYIEYYVSNYEGLYHGAWSGWLKELAS